MTKEDAAKILEYPVYKWSLDWDEREDGLDYGEAIKIAIYALRAQQTPAKLDRIRWEGCDICTKKLCSTCRYGGFMPGRPCIDCHSGSLYKERQRNFCQNCGRPLTEEAWAKLERRISGGQD